MPEETDLFAKGDPYIELNQAKRLCWQHCSDVVKFLVDVVANPDQDIDLRVTAADALLAFANRAI